MRHLRVFRAVVEAGTVSDAAHTLALTQSSVSKSLASLEAELGFLLFDRIGRRLKLSQQGKLFLDRIGNVIEIFSEIETAAADIRDNKGKRLRICAIGPILYSRLVPAALARFAATHADHRFSVDMIARIQIEEWVAQGNSDLGFTLLPVDTNIVNFRAVASGDMVAVVPKGHRLADRDFLAPSDLVHEHVIMPRPGVRVRGLVEAAFVEAGHNLSVQTQTTTMISVAHLVSSGLGIGVVDSFTITGIDQRNVRIIPWIPAVTLNYGVIWPKTRNLTVVEEDFVACVNEVAMNWGPS